MEVVGCWKLWMVVDSLLSLLPLQTQLVTVLLLFSSPPTSPSDCCNWFQISLVRDNNLTDRWMDGWMDFGQQVGSSFLIDPVTWEPWRPSSESVCVAPLKVRHHLRQLKNQLKTAVTRDVCGVDGARRHCPPSLPPPVRVTHWFRSPFIAIVFPELVTNLPCISDVTAIRGEAVCLDGAAASEYWAARQTERLSGRTNGVLKDQAIKGLTIDSCLILHFVGLHCPFLHSARHCVLQSGIDTEMNQ